MTVSNLRVSVCFSVNATPTTEIYTLSLHDALPICTADGSGVGRGRDAGRRRRPDERALLVKPCARGSRRDRKSTRLNSSHPSISYAVFCLKKKKQFITLRMVKHTLSR